MARKNRVLVPDGIYHVTSRIAHKAMLFASDEVKDFIVRRMHDVAAFSGVELYAWCIMDNHLHMLVHVPPVPKRLRDDPDEEPAAWAFGMRPPEVNPPMRGECPRIDRPSLGFSLSDEEMIGRLKSLYSKERAEEISESWKRARATGNGGAVDAKKRAYCRRMYNLSEFTKTLKEQLTQWYNARFDHEGCLWQGRFYSGIVEDSREVLAVVAGYIACNPVKAHLVAEPGKWKHDSFSMALGEGPLAQHCRKMYASMFDCTWEEARRIMIETLDDRLPEEMTDTDVNAYLASGIRNSSEMGVSRLRASQLLRCRPWFMRAGGYIGRTMNFAKRSLAHLPERYPHLGFGSIAQCMRLDWTLRIAA